jgi:two-component system chemotaxis response regulator CheB
VYFNDERKKAMLAVYIVDDSQAMRQRLTELVFDISGIEVVGQSADPFEALNRIRKSNPDVVIPDIRLPGRSGIDLLKDTKKIQLRATVAMSISSQLTGILTRKLSYAFSWGFPRYR